MVEGIRKEELRKVPGVAETLDWAAALVGLEVRDLHDDPETVHETMMRLVKTRRTSRASPVKSRCGFWGRWHELLRTRGRWKR